MRAIYPATSASEKVRFNTLNRATGNRLKRKMVDAVTEEEVPTEEQIKGYAVGEDQYVQVEDDELANIAIESSHTVDIEKVRPEGLHRRSLPRHPLLPRPRRPGRTRRRSPSSATR